MADTQNPHLKASPVRASDPAAGSDTFAAAVDKTLEKCGRGFHANGTGTVQIAMPDGTTPTFNVVDGNYYPYECVGFIGAGTDVDGIVLL